MAHARAPARILLVDTIGELSAWWGASHIAFVGGSFGERGGQNMIEPAAYGAAVLFGPHVWNFKDTASILIGEGAAVQLPDADALGREVVCLMFVAIHRVILTVAVVALVAGNSLSTFASSRLSYTGKHQLYDTKDA